MSARTGFIPRSAGAAALVAGDIVRQRLGLHCNEPNARWIVRRVTPTGVQMVCASRGRGPKMRDRVFTFSTAQAASMLVRVYEPEYAERAA